MALYFETNFRVSLVGYLKKVAKRIQYGEPYWTRQRSGPFYGGGGAIRRPNFLKHSKRFTEFDR